LEDKKNKFIKDVEALQDKHKLKIQAVLQVSLMGVLPQIVILPQDDKPSK